MPLNESEISYSTHKISAQRFAGLILDMGTFLMASGAHCGRINSNLSRLAGTWGFDMDIHPSFKGLLVTVKDINNTSNTFTAYKSSPPHNVRFSVITDISHLSWEVWDDKLSIEEVEERFEKIKETKGYPYWVTALAVGISCAGLCLFSFGDWINAIVAFLGASIGFFVKYKVAKLEFNPMLVITLAAFITTMISGTAHRLGYGVHPEAAMATAVLYLIPGVPLVNTVIDLIEGYLASALNRTLFAGFILLCIAAGMTLCITILGINNFN